MRILFAHRYDPSFRMGGAARFVLELCLPLRSECHVDVACVTNEGELADKLAAAGIPVYKIPYARSRTPAILKGAAEAIKDFKPDVIHSHHRYLTFLLDVFFKRTVRILHTEHVLREDKRLFFRPGHHATAVSQAVRDNLIHYYRMREAQVTCIPNAVRVRRADEAKLTELERRYRSGGGRLLGLCVGRLDEQKGHTYLIQALSFLPAALRAKILILLAGEGPLSASLMTEAAKTGVSSCLEFLGHTQDVPEFLQLCDLFILPSLWEGMPLSVLEAYQAGKPVLATDIAGTREVVVQGKTGVLVPPKDPSALAEALGGFIRNPSRYQEMKDAIDRRAEEFSFETLLRRYGELYQELIRKHAVP